MAHPIHQANKNSPYGILSREEFHSKHHIIHHQSFMSNNQNMKIFTQSWRPDHHHPTGLRGIVAMIHGYTAETSWLLELTAVAIAKTGFLVCALDLQGHGYSEGYPGHIPNIQLVVDDCSRFFGSVRAENPKVPAFLYGESLGGAIAVLMCLKQQKEWNGLVLHGAMCGVSKKMKPVWPIEKLLPIAACIAPKWKIVITRPPESISYKEAWKRKLVQKSPNRGRLASGKPLAATAMEFLRVCEFIERNCCELEVPVLVVHGGNDKGAIGALDGILVHAVVPVDQQTRYRGRGRGECYQNALGICDFNMIFTFVWAGWEGIAHDSRVLKEVAFDPSSGFPFPPPDKYCLCDAAYINTRGFLSPYRNTRYWLADFRRRHALNKEEKFNHAHAQLRNVIERVYGVLKARFPILKRMAPYPFTVQRDIVIACFAVHNFIRKHNIEDELFAQYDRDNMFDIEAEQNEGSEEEGQDEPQWGDQGVEFMVNLREQIALQLLTTV